MAFSTPYDYQRHRTHSGLTAAEYMTIEEYTERRHEFIHGDMIWLPDITLLHSRTNTNIWITLHKQLNNTPFNAWNSMLKIEAIKDKVILYPGVSVGLTARQQPDSYFIKDPILILEIHTPTTEAYNKGEKFSYYQHIPSLQYYLLVALDMPSVQVFCKKDDGNWCSDLYSSLSDTIHFPLLSASISLSSIYE